MVINIFKPRVKQQAVHCPPLTQNTAAGRLLEDFEAFGIWQNFGIWQRTGSGAKIYEQPFSRPAEKIFLNLEKRENISEYSKLRKIFQNIPS